jgi:hypothetical protein
MNRHRHIRTLSVFLLAMIALILSAAAASAAAAKKPPVLLSIKKIFFEYNSTASAFGDLGVHVFLDGEDWKEIKIINPDGRTIFDVEGKGPYKELGMTELFFEGAEPDLADVPLQELLDKFPAGDYKFVGRNVDGDKISDTATLSHAIPAGPTIVSAVLNGDGSLTITWNKVTGIPNNPNVTFPNEPINVVAYQVIVSDFQVTVPATGANTQSVTVSKEYVASLDSGEQLFEVLAIDISGNQTITESSFIKP